MKIDVPVLNEDGSLKFTQTLDAAQTQMLLQFALNFLTAAGLTSVYQVQPEEHINPGLND